jgi:succinoglycan biosynthesis protein ExoM
MRAAGRVAIGVCTARRPELLKCCLAALAAQIIPESVDLTLVIADNEPEPNNQPVVAEYATSCPFRVEYVHEPHRGISRARNALLRACEGRFDWIAMTDDDCKPTPTWLADMLAAAQRHGADVVRGRHVWVAPESGAYWYAPETVPRYAEGERIDMPAAATCSSPAGLRGRGSTSAWPTARTRTSFIGQR